MHNSPANRLMDVLPVAKAEHIVAWTCRKTHLRRRDAAGSQLNGQATSPEAGASAGASSVGRDCLHGQKGELT
ncbi:hypothetical protein GWI33_014842 [Rhynchophorus ferrugineus]|uniref:Uncharacterized protein n=1 Tax=Rhynchophorus ferrugineus TaxID=354439 RepID=A0A834M6I1_RHYFE|nr:hypothetical protein GWI33_014842 [Rhynchophorus ferrugineus]